MVTGTSAELAAPGIPVTVALGSTTDFRATAEAEGFVSSCSASLRYTQQDPTTQPPVDGPGGGAGGGPEAGPLAVPKTPKGLAYVTPRTRITFGPAFKTRLRRPVFRFADSTGQPGTRFLCRLDRGGWRPCASPTRLKAVGRGRHTFQVKGINAIGMAEEAPVARSFKVAR